VAQQANDESKDRRRHTRFDMANAPSELWLIPSGGSGSDLEPCRLLNLSFGGMCFAVSHSLEQLKTYPFRIKLADLDPDAFSVKAEIRWTYQQGGEGWLIGAAFRESAKGWVGPDDRG
jgi:hypothetical protein